ncbi:GNAT family N-acetyltransferase [Cytobacillus spongiae]|jgi:ribosomal protein S18 acetylase RimI-like enzyme|uniref:GNAT family N-acetyltransferase n=1 Tax=Cytobacillus spongiae TaxID=2901381 RepID=UPI001F40AE6C|nr:GNAT family protein [Cytobacillus spongiae]UII54494.1 GNAT family N-acetyltransferase [Cytobacillus spongiae]
MNIRILEESDAILYQQLRLGALQTNPSAFRSTYAREVHFSIETVAERIKPTKNKFVLGSFDSNGFLVGTVTFMREDQPRTAHKGNIFAMYVSPENRGKGIGKSLLVELIKHASILDGLELINLTVVSTNDSAKKLYETIGFNVYGTERKAFIHEGQYYDEDLMVLSLH